MPSKIEWFTWNYYQSLYLPCFWNDQMPLVVLFFWSCFHNRLSSSSFFPLFFHALSTLISHSLTRAQTHTLRGVPKKKKRGNKMIINNNCCLNWISSCSSSSSLFTKLVMMANFSSQNWIRTTKVYAAVYVCKRERVFLTFSQCCKCF